MPDTRTDPAIFQEFREALGTRDPKTIAAYLATLRDFVIWLAMQPGGVPFHLGLVTETAVRGYMNALQRSDHAPRTRSSARDRALCAGLLGRLPGERCVLAGNGSYPCWPQGRLDIRRA